MEQQRDGWPERLSEVIAADVRRRRLDLGLSTQQLSDECGRLGHPIARAVLSNLENGRRENVTVAELLVLSKALRVEPVFLLAPVGFVETVEMLPGVHMTADDAVAWISGDESKRNAEVDGKPTVYALRSQERTMTSLLERAAEVGIEDQANVERLTERYAQVERQTFDAFQALYDVDSKLARATSRVDPDAAEIAELEDRKQELEKQKDDLQRLRSDAYADMSLAEKFGGARFEEVVGGYLQFRAELRNRGMIVPPLPPHLAARVEEETAG